MTGNETKEPVPLEGCKPTPLASYLKALGVLRLISSDANHVSGKAADPCARGAWQDERFVLRTSMKRHELLEFFLHDYSPSPLIAPWNGGSGFYAKDNKEGIGPLSSSSIAKRFQPISSAIQGARRILDDQGVSQSPKNNEKVHFVSVLRAEASDETLHWIDAALSLSGDTLNYPQLLGTGGNDGRLDFTNNFMHRLVSKTKKHLGLFDASSGTPNDDARRLLTHALFGTSSQGLYAVPIGQFAPGSAGAPNGTTGYKGSASVNAWDFVLMLEGSVYFAGAATRRLAGSVRPGSSFPYTVRMVGAGWGGVEASDEHDARAEFWAPLWSRPARSCEVDALLTEGRVVLNGRSPRDGLEFARSVTNLGVSRGFFAFERYGFLMRSGRAFLAAPIGRRSVGPSPASSLVRDLDRNGWLERVRQTRGTDNGSTAARAAIKRFEDAVFELLDSSPSPRSVQSAIVGLGEVSRWLSISPKGRELIQTPPPPMTAQWTRSADDRSPEFRVAVALAGLGLQESNLTQPETVSTGAATVGTAEGANAMPMAIHFGPVSESGFAQRRIWAKDTTERNVVWGSGDLVANMLAVLDRRLVEARARGLDDKPLGAATGADLEDVLAFLSGDFDDGRCAALLAGLIWIRPASLRKVAIRPRPIPFAFAALKPLFSPDAVLCNLGVFDTGRLPIPPGILSRLRTGRRVNEAVRIGLNRARSSALASPFDPAGTGGRGSTRNQFSASVSARRLAAALLIPLRPAGLSTLINRAYPGAIAEHDTNTTEDAKNAA